MICPKCGTVHITPDCPRFTMASGYTSFQPTPTPITNKCRMYKCGKCGSEFDTMRSLDQIEKMGFCPFCGFGKRKVKK